MRGTSTQRTSARIQYSVYALTSKVLSVVRIKLLLSVICVVADKKVPLDCFIFRCESMKGGHVVIVGQPVYIRLNWIASVQHPRIAAGFQHNHRVTGFGEPRSDCSSSCAGANNYVFTAVGLV